MRRAVILLALLLLTGFRETPNRSTFLLPANSSDATRAGFSRWAATAEGQKIIRHLNPEEFRVVIAEDPTEDGAGRAPQPGIATLIAANDHAKLKTYTLILNPTYGFERGKSNRIVALPGLPTTAADLMSVAWAGEMLHIEFYARGISLPHHNRPDFQDEWQAVAGQLGYPSVPHADQGDEYERPMPRRPRVVYWR